MGAKMTQNGPGDTITCSEDCILKKVQIVMIEPSVMFFAVCKTICRCLCLGKVLFVIREQIDSYQSQLTPKVAKYQACIITFLFTGWRYWNQGLSHDPSYLSFGQVVS